MRIGELSHKIAVSRIHAWRLAKSGVVPGTRRTKGGHYYFIEGPALSRWIGKMRSYKFRKNELSRAYERYYGSEKILNQRNARHHLMHFRKSGRRSRINFSRKYLTSLTEYEYYDLFHDTVHQLETILDDWGNFTRDWKYDWPKEIQRAMQNRLISLAEKLKDYLPSSDNRA